jgi:hypothetical protein
MFDAIKTLSSKQRLFAFVFAVILTSITTVLTVYYKSGDCKPISDQYINLLKNQSILMSTNNKLHTSYDSLFNDMLKVKGEVRKLKFSLDSIESIRSIKILENSKSNLIFDNSLMVSPVIDSIYEITNKYDSSGVKH